VTSDLVKRIYEHKSGATEGFSKDHDIKRLVYFEVFEEIQSAIAREKKIKKWQREWKIGLIEKENPDWNDRYAEICK